MTSTTHKPLTFDLDRNEQEVTIGGDAYILVELDGKDRDKYLNNLGARIRTTSSGQPGGVKNFEGLQAALVAASLFKVVNDEREAVGPKTIQGWPAQVVTSLFNAAKTLSALDEDDDEDNEGND